jgi:iron complex outermembrane receptor protein
VLVPPQLLAQVAPTYPQEALHDRLVADVVVLVTVSPEGLVTDAVIQSGGPDVFAAPAIEAARQLQFVPATRGGQAVSVKLPVHFHFAPPPDELPAEADETLVIQAVRSPTAGEAHAVVIVDAATLARLAGDDLAESIANVPGVALGRSTADGTKPIIRGQQERRLLVLFDGVRHESQKWGLDHATEIDPFTAGSVHVVKGAAGVRYGPDAIGGVVLVEPHPLRSDPGVGGRVQSFGETNGLRGGLAARVDGAHPGGWAWRAEADAASGASLSTPDYVLGNTASRTWNAGATVARSWQHGEASVAWHHYDLVSGVTFAARAGSPDELEAQLTQAIPVGAESWETSYAIERAYQDVSHDIARARLRNDLGSAGELETTYAFQLNRRLEYDHARDTITGPQYDFTLRTHSLDAKWSHRDAELAFGRLHGEAGVSGSFQENVYVGLPLVPNFRGLQFGAHASERLALGALSIEAGTRYDRLSRTAFLTDAAYRRGLGRGTITESDCALSDDVARCAATYDAGSASLGLVWMAVPDRLEARLDMSSATRFPNIDELYMNGSAPTSPVYAVGDAGLGPETTWGASPTIGLHLPWLHLEASAFANRIEDYIYFAPELGPDGTPLVDVTVQGAFPRFAFRAIDAWFYGADGSITLLPGAPVHLDLQGALVRAHDAATGAFLVMIPPDRLKVALDSAPLALGALGEGYGSLGLEHVFEQTRVDPDADVAPPPDAYTLVDAELGVHVPLGARTLEVGLLGRNLFDARYRDYTSLLRYYADEPGRSVRLRVGIDL